MWKSSCVFIVVVGIFSRISSTIVLWCLNLWFTYSTFFVRFRCDGSSNSTRKSARNVTIRRLDFRAPEARASLIPWACWGASQRNPAFSTVKPTRISSSPIPCSRSSGIWWVLDQVSASPPIIYSIWDIAHTKEQGALKGIALPSSPIAIINDERRPFVATSHNLYLSVS